MQHPSSYPGPDACIAAINQAYERNKDTLKPKSADADLIIQECHDQLRQHQVKFHLAAYGRWVIDKVPCPILDNLRKEVTTLSHYEANA